MTPFRKILLATDFSHAAQNALEHAAVLAKRSNAEVHALHVNLLTESHVKEPDMPDPGAYAMALAKASKDHLERLEIEPEVRVQNVVRSDLSPVNGVLSYAEEAKVDLIVMGTHGRTGLKHMLLGSVAAQVLRGAWVPVLVVGTGKGHEVDDAGISCIVAPTDLSEASKDGLRRAAELAREHGAKLHIVHVIARPLASIYNPNTPTTEQLKADGEKALRDFVGTLELGPDVESEVLVGEGFEGIIAAADHHQADLVVMSALGMSAIGRLLLGSVAEKVARTSPCPVLVCRSPEG